MINRKIYNRLESFFDNSRQALLVTGARQVGKTYAIRKVGRECFKHFVEFNFVENQQLATIFKQPTDAQSIILRLSAFADSKLVPNESLIFFDEVQECPEVVTAIKFLVDEGSYRYVMSGSLLGVELNNLRSVPVGYMAIEEMYPLDFEEFANALGMSDMAMEHLRKCFNQQESVDAVVHNKMMELHRLYLIVGGMPAVVMKYLTTNNMQEVRGEQKNIINLYRKDISKYDKGNSLYIKDIFDIIPSELNAKNKRFIMKSLNENAKFNHLKNSFLWLANAGVAIPVYNVEEPQMPLKLNEQRNLFKLFLNDVGLLAAMYSQNFQSQMIIGETNLNFGAIYENFAAQELRSHGCVPYYFNSKKQGELDFVVELDGKVLPIEIKSGKDYKRHNALHNVMQTKNYELSRAIVFTNNNIESVGNILYLPIYMLMYIESKAIENPIVRFEPI